MSLRLLRNLLPPPGAASVIRPTFAPGRDPFLGRRPRRRMAVVQARPNLAEGFADNEMHIRLNDPGQYGRQRFSFIPNGSIVRVIRREWGTVYQAGYWPRTGYWDLTSFNAPDGSVHRGWMNPDALRVIA